MIYRTSSLPGASAPPNGAMNPPSAPKIDPAVRQSLMHGDGDRDLLRRTLRTALVLVLACVVFVGALSVVAVAVTSRAVGASNGTTAQPVDGPAKKPLSI